MNVLNVLKCCLDSYFNVVLKCCHDSYFNVVLQNLSMKRTLASKKVHVQFVQGSKIIYSYRHAELNNIFVYNYRIIIIIVLLNFKLYILWLFNVVVSWMCSWQMNLL